MLETQREKSNTKLSDQQESLYEAVLKIIGSEVNRAENGYLFPKTRLKTLYHLEATSKVD